MTESSETANRLTALRGVQLVFGAGCVAVALPLMFRLGPAETVTNATSVRVLEAALPHSPWTPSQRCKTRFVTT